MKLKKYLEPDNLKRNLQNENKNMKDYISLFPNLN
jgi:hypothetical protein